MRAIPSLVLFLFAAVAAAQHPLGEQFQVNSYTPSFQFDADVSPDGSGGFVVVWQSTGSSGGDDSSSSVQLQRYESDGTEVGGELQVNTYTTEGQARVAVSPDGSGGFVVVWDSDGSYGNDNSDRSIQAQRFDAVGDPVGSEFQVNTYTTDRQTAPTVAPDGAGGFVVAWESSTASGNDTTEAIQAQRFDAAGSPVGSEFQVNTYTPNTQNDAAVSSDGAGGFVIVWSSIGSGGDDTSSQSVQGQRFDETGAPAGDEFQVNSYTTNAQNNPDVSPDGSGGFVVTWESDGSSGGDDSEQSIQAQRFDADGDPVGPQFQVNTYTTGSQRFPEVSPNGFEGFVVVWRSEGSNGTDDSSYSIQGQRFDAEGAPLGGEFQVNTYTSGPQGFPTVGLDGSGDFVVAWDSLGSDGSDSSSYSIQAKRVDDGIEIFSDGFESGNTSAWSTTVP